MNTGRNDPSSFTYAPLSAHDAQLDSSWRARYATVFVREAGFGRERLAEAGQPKWLTIGISNQGGATSIKLTSHYTGGTKWFYRDHYDNDDFIEAFASEAASDAVDERRRDGSTYWDLTEEEMDRMERKPRQGER